VAIFALADPHLSFGCAKPMDVFAGWADYVRRIETNWRAAVAQSDTVVLPGDISWGMSLEEALPDFAFLHGLPGTKILLKGNHDYWWNTRKKVETLWAAHGLGSLRLLHNNAFFAEDRALCGSRGWFFDSPEPDAQKVLLREAGRLRVSIREGKRLAGGDMERLLVFLHYPPIAGGEVCREIMDVLVQEGARRCCYGHLHGYAVRGAFQGVAEGVRFELVSADALGFSPKRIA
jgi:predicted phosphohydrolase